MQSVQESKQELEAAIRYAENAISSAKTTIESMEFRQEMAKKQYSEQTGREESLTKLVKDLEEANEKLAVDNSNLEKEVQRQQNLGQGYYDSMMTFKAEVEKFRKEKEASSGPCGCQAYRDIEEAQGRAEGEVELLQRTISELEDQNLELKEKVQAQFDDIDTLKYQLKVRAEKRDEEVGVLKSTIAELEAKVQGQYDDIVMLERDLADLRWENAGEENAIKQLKEQNRDLRMQIESNMTNMALLTDEAEFYKKSYTELEVAQGMGVPTMPVIPKAVAIAIFREGVQHGVEAACTELDNASDISIEENEYCGDFEVSFSKYIDLSEHLDTDWMRDKCGDYDEASVIEALKNLCADKEFECRIHGVDDQEQKNAD